MNVGEKRLGLCVNGAPRDKSFYVAATRSDESRHCEKPHDSYVVWLPEPLKWLSSAAVITKFRGRAS